MNQGGHPNKYPGGGNHPAGGQYPGQGGSSPGGYPNQYPARGGVNPGGYPNHYPSGGSYPSGGQYPGGGGVNPNQYPAGRGYPAAGGYPVRTGQPGGQPGGYPGGYPSMGGSYPNWNPNNQILSPRYGGGFGSPGYGIGGSPFSKTVHNMGYKPSVKSKGFAKKAILAAGVGAMTGMAVGYGLGRFPRPHFQFSSRQEEQYYNHYMQQRYGMKSADTNDYRHDYTFKPPPKAQTYEKYMDNCMNRSDLLQNRDAKISVITTINESLAVSNGISENGTTKPVESQERDDTVSITEIGYPALIQQMKARKCVQLYMAYSESFLQKQTQQKPSSSSDPPGHPGLLVLLITAIMSLGSNFLLQ